MGLLNSLGKLGHCIMDTSRSIRIVTLISLALIAALALHCTTVSLSFPGCTAMLEQQVEQERSYQAELAKLVVLLQERGYGKY